MATEIKKVLTIDTTSLKEYKNHINELRGELLALQKGSEEYAEVEQEIQKETTKLNEVLKAGKTQAELVEGSYNKLNKELVDLRKSYKNLSEEERESASGKEMLVKIQGLDKELKNLDKSIGVNTRNVGDYGNQFVTAFTSMGGASNILTGGIGKVNAAMKMLMANPIIAAIAAIVVVFMKLSDAIKGSEELTNRMNSALSTFKPIMDIVTNGMTKLAEGVVKGFELMSKAVIKTIGWLADLAEKVGWDKQADFLRGITDEMNAYNEEEKESQELAKERRRINEENATLEKESASLRAKIAEKDKYSDEQRLAWAKKWQENQKKIADNNVSLAKTELDLLTKQGQHTANNAEYEDKLSAAKVKVTNAERDREEAVRQSNKTIAQLNINLSKQAENLSDVEEETRKLIDTEKEWNDFLAQQKQQEDIAVGTLDRNLEFLDKDREKKLFYANLEIQDEKEKQEQIYQIKKQAYEDSIALIEDTLNNTALSFEEQERLQKKLSDTQWGLEQLNATHHAQSENTQTKTTKEQVALRMTTAATYMNSMANLMNNLSDLAEEGSEEQKALQIMGVTLSTLSGIVSAISGAMQLGPIAGPIVGAINSAAVLAAGITNIAKMKSTTKENNENLGGATGASFSGVSVTPLLNQGRDLQSLQTIPVQQETQQQDMRVYVVESDITNAQNTHKTKVQESSF